MKLCNLFKKLFGIKILSKKWADHEIEKNRREIPFLRHLSKTKKGAKW